MYWSGWRQFDGFGTYTFDMNNLTGKCQNIAWKGFSGSSVQANFNCSDYEPQYK